MEQQHNLFAGAKRLADVRFSPIRTVLDRAKALENSGHWVIPLSAGEPDFDTPQPIKAATIRALNNNMTHYGSNRGAPRLREAIAQYLLTQTGVAYNPQTELLVTTSGAEAINHAILASIDPGDEVIIFSPAFVSYENLVRMCGGIVVDIPLKKQDAFQIDVEAVRASITGKTKMIILNNPCNPTGMVYTKPVLEGLCRLACQHNLLVFSDEIYANLTYDGAPFYSIAAFPGMRERTITMNGFSKAFAMTGWRLGYLAADERLINHMVKVHQYATTCSPTFIQEGVADAMNSPETLAQVDAMVAAFARRRKRMLSGLDSMAQLSYVAPNGAFYVLVDVSQTGLTGEEFAAKLLDQHYVATIPGAGLGSGCGDLIRLSFATSDKNIEEGLKRIEAFLRTL